MKKFNVLFLALLAVAFVFTSCEDDEGTVIDDPCEGITCDPGQICLGGQCVDAPVVVNSNITENTTWTADNVYHLETRVSVVPGVTLTIEPGTLIKGGAGQGANSKALVVARGATIIAEGTADAPIIFTSVADNLSPSVVASGDFQSPNLDPTINGLWGGVMILGNAPISASNDNDEDISEVQIEGIPSDDENGRYGGNDPADNSGTFTYVSIRHGGTNIGSGNEINGLTLGGVGSGTTVNNIEVVSNFDDGIEWFGGTVNVDNVLIWNVGDDAIDTDQAWSGTLNNFLIVSPDGNCFELDGPEGSATGSHTIQNGTIVSSGDLLSADLVNVDDNSMVELKNLWFTGVIGKDEDDNDVFQELEGTDGSAPGVSYEGVSVDIPQGTTLDQFCEGGVVPAGITAGGSNKIDVADFAWTWASQSGGLSGL